MNANGCSMPAQMLWRATFGRACISALRPVNPVLLGLHCPRGIHIIKRVLPWTDSSPNFDPLSSTDGSTSETTSASSSYDPDEPVQWGTTHQRKKYALPPLKEELYPEASMSTTSIYHPPTADERKGAQGKNDILYTPPPLPLEVNRIGIRPTPRLDGNRGSTLIPPRMNLRRHIPKVNYNSEYIFGYQVVDAALRAQKRKIYRLYIYAGKNRSYENKRRDERTKELARRKYPDIEIVDEPDVGNLDSMTDSQTHK